MWHKVSHANAIQLIAEAVHLGQESLKAEASGEVAVGVANLSEAVDAELLSIEVSDVDAVIEHVVLSVGLESAIDPAVLQKRLRARLETDCQSECE